MKSKLVLIMMTFILVEAISAQTTRKFELETVQENPVSAVQNYDSKKIEMVVQEWHNGGVEHLKWSNDGNYLMTAGDEIKIWEMRTGMLIRTYQWGQNGRVDMSPDGKYLLYKTKSGLVEICDILDGKIVFAEEIGKEAADLLFTPDGKHFVVIKDSKIQFYDINTFKKIFAMEDMRYDNYWLGAAFSSDGKYLATIARTDRNKGFVLSVVWNIASRTVVNVQTYENELYAVDISPGNTFIACGDKEGNVFVNKLTQGVRMVHFETGGPVFCLKFMPDGKNILATGGRWLSLQCYDSTTGTIMPYFNEDTPINVHGLAFSYDGKMLAVNQYGVVNVRATETGKSLGELTVPTLFSDVFITVNDFLLFKGLDKHFLFKENYTAPYMLSKLNGLLSEISVCDRGAYFCDDFGKVILFYDFLAEDRSFSLNIGEYINEDEYIKKVVASFDGKTIAFIDNKNRTYIYNIENKVLSNFESKYEIYQLIISSNGKYVAVSDGLKGTEIVDAVTGKVLDFPELIQPSFSWDDAYCSLSGEKNGKYETFLYDTNTWKTYRTEKYSPNIVFSMDKKYYAVFDSNEGQNVIVVKTMDGKEIKRIRAGERYYKKLFFNSSGTNIFALTYGGVLRCYSVQSGELLTSTIIADGNGDWLTYTPEGYFTGSAGGIDKFVHLVSGMQVIELGQMYDVLYRPDLVAAKLAGQDIGRAGTLKDIVSSGQPPFVQFTAVPSVAGVRDVQVEFTVSDMGGGVGYVYLKHNGKVMQLSSGEESIAGRKFIYTCSLSLSGGANEIETYAANLAGKIESRHAAATIQYDGKTTDTAGPALYVLAVGVDTYQNKAIQNLRFAVRDATAIMDAFKTAPGGIYSSVNVLPVMNEDVSLSGIQNAFDVLSQKVRPDDVFVLYLSGHGKMLDGEYYYIPADCMARNENDLENTAVSKHFITENLSKIRAYSTVLLLDTCDSGAFIAQESSALEQRTALERMAHTSGQAIITASSSTQQAAEGYNGHGVFTYALLQALGGRADGDGSGGVSVAELADYVDRTVPELARERWNHEQTSWSLVQGRGFSVVATGLMPPSRWTTLSLVQDAVAAAAGTGERYSMRIDDTYVVSGAKKTAPSSARNKRYREP